MMVSSPNEIKINAKDLIYEKLIFKLLVTTGGKGDEISLILSCELLR